MNTLLEALPVIGILSTAVVCGTDVFFLTVGRPALQRASPSSGTEVMGFFHQFADARMPIWGVLAIFSNLLLALFSGSGHRGFYFTSFGTLILFWHSAGIRKKWHSTRLSSYSEKRHIEC